jgi:hypothetical protein
MASQEAQPGEAAETVPPAAEGAAKAGQSQPKADGGTRTEAPPQGEGRSWTIDNRAGYRKEESADGRKRQIRFADREGGRRPDDELLETVRKETPMVRYAAKERAWQGRKEPDALEALDRADQALRDIGRKRGGHER